MTGQSGAPGWRRIAARQADTVTWSQLIDTGLSRHQIVGRVQRGELRRLHPRVYLTSAAPPSRHTLAWAGALYCGARAVVSHRIAAALYLPRLETPPTVDVTVVARNPGRTAGVRVHRATQLKRSEYRYLDGLPVTTPARTVLDLAGTRPRAETEFVLQELLYARKLTDRELRRAVDEHPRHRGIKVLGAILELEGPSGSGHTRSEAERALMRIIRDAGLPRPVNNLVVEGEPADAAWPDRRLIVEVDGGRAHANAPARARDRRRDQRLIAAGWRVLRFTAREVFEEPLRVAARLAAALSAAA